MESKANLAGRFAFPGSSFTVNRLGYGAMKTTGSTAWGPPKDRAGVVAVLREAIALGINHIDTSDYYGPHIANEIIRETLYPYPSDLVIVTKVGARRRSTGFGGKPVVSTPKSRKDGARRVQVQVMPSTGQRLRDLPLVAARLKSANGI
jgi:aryl-alcohol dehydrogenase-like predicted oxidoreductase